MNKAQELNKLGLSIWFDNIDRTLLDDGSLAAKIEAGEIYGMTSNPSLFEKAIGNSQAYDDSLQAMSWSGMNTEEIYLQLVISDIQRAADLFLPLYQKTIGGDGYVSLEVSPLLAHDTEATIQEAKELWALVDRPNLMVKVPATDAGIPAIQALTAAGLNTNATLIFSVERYYEVMEAYISGLEQRHVNGLTLDKIASVASFFVSRIDTAVDNLLSSCQALPKGHTAVDNTRMAFQAYKSVFDGERFAKLAEAGAQRQRPLWASTGTKNPAYSDVMYVDKLIGPGCVNTAPPNTIEAFLDHGDASRCQIEDDLEGARKRLQALESAGISLKAITDKLENDGVEQFAVAFRGLLATIDTKRKKFVTQLGPLADQIPALVREATDNHYVSRLFDHDPSLWTQNKSEHEEICERLGWLDLPGKQFELVQDYQAFAQECMSDGLRYAFVLGMGGSSLAPEVMSLALSPEVPAGKGMQLAIIDTTNPDEIQERLKGISLSECLFVVSSKSGTTSETNAALNYFWEACKDAGLKQIGRHFCAVTDPGTSLEKLAIERGFRRVFKAPADVGGRFSVFTAFGLLPAALMGINLPKLLTKGANMASFSGLTVPYAANPPLVLGLTLAQAALNGADKLTFLTDGFAATLVPWLEQLIAESSGKEGKGILPIEGEPVQPIESYGKDRIFAYMRVDGAFDALAQALLGTGYTVLSFQLSDSYDLGSEFYRWEYATAIACAKLGINAFNQPNVQDNKSITKQKISEYQTHGQLTEGEPIWENQEALVYGASVQGIEAVNSLTELIKCYTGTLPEGGYVVLSAYLARNADTHAALQRVRETILKQTGKATTLGFGPRFLHSTGQLHKGGPDGGLFIILTKDPEQDIEIPGEGMSFGTLQKAQALGDLDALRERNKLAIRIHLKTAGPEILA